MRFVLAALLALSVTVACWAQGSDAPAPPTGNTIVLGYNDLGMHCMNQDFSQFMILPPYNTLHAQVVSRAKLYASIVSDGVTVDYTIPGNTHSSDKTNFWTYANALLGVTLAPDVGLTGNRLSGAMAAEASGDWLVTGIPITPITDAGAENPYQLATISVTAGGSQVAQTQAVVPVSWEINCNLCHGAGEAGDPLSEHDDEIGTTLSSQKPVLCGKCHAQAALGAPGEPGVPSLSRAIHSFHADKMSEVLSQTNGVTCYACHPGIRTQCLRDVHYSKGMQCTDCHGQMSDVGSASRRPWVDEPKCSSCHSKAGSAYEQPATLYRNSRGHGGIHCEACHGSPHAVTPTVKTEDNVQAITLQGHAGTIDVCVVCHASQPTAAMPHRWLFPDLTPGFWARDAILAAFTAGIVTGYPDDTYQPSVALDRATMAVYIARALAGGDANVPAGPRNPSFSDVPVGFWAFRHVEYAKSKSIVAGYSDGLYHPDLTLDRGQMAAFVARSMASPTGDAGLAGYTPPATPTFPDVPADFWAYKYVEYVASNGVAQGYTDGKYHPEIGVTRDQMAVYVAKAFKLPM